MNRGIVKTQEVKKKKFTSGTVKLMAISSRKGWSKASRLVKKGLCWSFKGSRTAPPGRWSWNCGMMRCRRRTREGTIYRTKWARVNLTYHSAVSVKSEDTQEDIVTVRMVIKGLCRRFDRKRSWSGDILLCEISWSVHRQRLVTVILPMDGWSGDICLGE